MKRKSGWDEPPPGMAANATSAPVAMPPLSAPVPAALALPAPVAAGIAEAAAAAAMKPSSIQAALEAQKKMLAAKAAALAITGPTGVVVPAPPAPPAPPPDIVDPAITLAIAKAKAAALKTCTSDTGGANGPSAIDNAKALLQQSSAAVAAFPHVKTTLPNGLPKPAAPIPPLRPGLVGQSDNPSAPRPALLQQVLNTLQSRGALAPAPAALPAPGALLPPAPALPALVPLSAGKGIGTASVVRPPARFPVGTPKLLPLLTPSVPQSTTSKAAPAGLAAAGATAKQTTPAPLALPSGLGPLAAMKEVSPALAALMQGGLF